MPRLRCALAAATVLLSLATGRGWSQADPGLPPPSGPSPVGKASFHWIDSSRPEPATADAADKREILVQVWYPAAKPGRDPAPYLPGAVQLASSAAAESLSRLFGPAWQPIVSGRVRTHSFDGAPVAPGSKLPVLLFSPGGGVPVAAYTAQMEDLASHGYVVVGVEDIYDAPGAVFPGGRVATAAHDYFGQLRRRSADAESYEKALTDARAADLGFVVTKLKELDGDPASAFRARLDLARIGAFGHSRGGRSAVRAGQLDPRIRACLNQDGSFSWHPFWLDPNGRSLQQPFLMLDHFDPDPPEEMFTKMGTTREQYAGRRSARQASAREKLYSTIAGGSYHVTIRTPGVSHNSFLDIRQFGRADGSGINAWPEPVRAATPNRQILRTIGTWTRAFFDKSVRDLSEPFASLTRSPAGDVEVRSYAPAAR